MGTPQSCGHASVEHDLPGEKAFRAKGIPGDFEHAPGRQIEATAKR